MPEAKLLKDIICKNIQKSGKTKWKHGMMKNNIKTNFIANMIC